MREPVPDPVAQEFLKHFLQAFSRNVPFYLAVRRARERLQGLEKQFPYASWLPTIYQNPAAIPPTWMQLGRLVMPATPEKPQPSWQACIQRYPLLTGIALSVAVTLLVISIRLLGLLQPSELGAYDHLMQQRPAELLDERLVVVEVTEDYTSKYGYPVQDDKLADLIEQLLQHQPRSIGLNMHRYHPRGEGRASLIRHFNQNSNLFMLCFRYFDPNNSKKDNSHDPPPEFEKSQVDKQVGFSNLLLDKPLKSWMVRRQFLSYDPNLAPSPSACSTPYSFSLKLALHYLEKKGIQLELIPGQGWRLGKIILKKLPARFGGYQDQQDVDGKSNQIMINYRAESLPAQQITFSQILSGQIDLSEVKDRIVLIGVTAPVAGDTSNTPLGEMTGVWIQAHMLSQLLSAVLDGRPLIRGLPQWRSFQWGDWLWILGWTGLGTGIGSLLGWNRRSWLMLSSAVLVATFALYQVCRLLLNQGIWLPLVPSVFAFMISVTLVRVYNSYYFDKSKKSL